MTPKSVQEPPKIDPETPSEPPRHHPDTKSLPKTSQEPPQTSQRPSQERFRITFSSKNEPPNHNFRVRNFQFPKSIRRSLLSEAGGTGLAPLDPPPPASGRCTACEIFKSFLPPYPPAARRLRPFRNIAKSSKKSFKIASTFSSIINIDFRRCFQLI